MRKIKEKIWQTFNKIAHRYDLLNSILSLKQDSRWRLCVNNYVPLKDNLKLLDVACGTGDLTISLVKNLKQIVGAIGIDMAEEMLKIGNSKIRKENLQAKIIFKKEDACDLSFENETFDLVTVSFGIRNISPTNIVLREILRVLRPGGVIIILEFSIPENPVIRKPYLIYLRHVLPFIGGIMSGHMNAYRYLGESVENFPCGNDFLKIMNQSGFINAKLKKLTFGIASIYYGEKAEK